MVLGASLGRRAWRSTSRPIIKTLTVSALDMRSLLPVVAAQLDEPLADVAAIPTYLLSRFAREHVTVALTGEGADELFAGYNRYRLECDARPVGAVADGRAECTARGGKARRRPAPRQGARRGQHGSRAELRLSALGHAG